MKSKELSKRRNASVAKLTRTRSNLNVYPDDEGATKSVQTEGLHQKNNLNDGDSAGNRLRSKEKTAGKCKMMREQIEKRRTN